LIAFVIAFIPQLFVTILSPPAPVVNILPYLSMNVIIVTCPVAEMFPSSS